MIAIIAAIAELLFLSDRSDHIETGLKYLLKLWLRRYMRSSPSVQPLPRAFCLRKWEGWEGMRLSQCYRLAN